MAGLWTKSDPGFSPWRRPSSRCRRRRRSSSSPRREPTPERERIESPWSLKKAFSPPTAVKPGDTIWLRGGTYTGSNLSHLKGLPNKPIIVRQYPGEHVIFDNVGTGNNPALDVRGLYTWYWGFEVINSGTDRGSRRGGRRSRRGRPPARPRDQADQPRRARYRAGSSHDGRGSRRGGHTGASSITTARTRPIAAMATASTSRTKRQQAHRRQHHFRPVRHGASTPTPRAASSTTSTSKATRRSTTGCSPRFRGRRPTS